MPKVLVICPTFNHADTLYASISSVRAQQFTDWEMAVIGDGAPDRTFEILEPISVEDARIKIYRHPKSERFGEIYRDPVIRESDAEFICHLSDDDIWTPVHLDLMVELLEHAEWANQAPLRMYTNGKSDWWPINHGTAIIRRNIARRIPPSVGINYAAYRRDAYLRLPEGWTCAPWEDGTSDVYMWAKFFQNPDLKVASSASTSALKFPSSVAGRKHRTPEQRMAEIAPWLAKAAQPGLAEELCRNANIKARMFKLFSEHGAGTCHTLDEAFAAIGFNPSPPDAKPEPALNGEPMIVPLTNAQQAEALSAWQKLKNM
jgi:glycosyltransferase involved in cell wall biosynthesis